MKTIRWGMIGCGDVAEVKSGPAFYKARNSSLVAVMRRDGKLAADFARRHNVPRWHDDANAIIDAPDIDAVYIATHTDSHHCYAIRCAEARKPVYVEKPMALDPARCVEMVRACKTNRVPLWVGYYRRGLPRFLAIREMIANGEIGEVRMIAMRECRRAPTGQQLSSPAIAWRADPARGGGLFFEGACHTLDILDFMFGPITETRAFSINRAGGSEERIAASFRFESGVLASGAWCYCADRDEECNEIIGSRGSIQFSIFTATPIQLRRDGKVEAIAIGDPPHVHQPLVQSIVDELNGVGQCPSTGETALRTARVVDAVLAEVHDEPPSRHAPTPGAG
jgi:1,5-anhydro-D-fructose reductase (1,5-anhydro-D-mannitol-forming)